MRELLNTLELGLNYAVMYGAVAILVAVFIMEHIKEHKAKKQQEIEIKRIKHKEELEAKLMFKKRRFEEYRNYIDALPDEVDVKELEEQVEIKELKPRNVAYEDGINHLIMSTHHTYRPYEVKDFDIRDTLREFTVEDVLNTFYA